MLFLLVVLSITSVSSIVFASDTVELNTNLKMSGTETREYKNQKIIIHGVILVDQNASLRFKCCNITILWFPGTEGPHILVTKNAALVLEDSSLTIRIDLLPNYATTGKIEIRDNGGLMVQDSTIKCTSNMITWCRGSSETILNNATYSGRAPYSNLHWSLEDMLPDQILREYFDDYSIYCENSAEVSIIDSRVGGLITSDDATCIISGSTISLLDPISAEITQVDESRIKVLIMTQRESEIRLSGSVAGYYPKWSSKEFFGPDSITKIQLTESSFDHLWLSLSNCNTVIEDADLWLLVINQGTLSMRGSDAWIIRASYGNATIKDSNISYLVGERVDGDLLVEGCDIGWLGLTAFSRETQYHKVQATIENTTIESCAVNYWIVPFEVNVSFRDVVLGNLSMRPAPIYMANFENCRVTDTVSLYSMSSPEYSLNVRGNIDLLGASLEEYPNTLMSREYEVMVMQDDVPVEGAEIQLIKDDVVWRSGQTDEDGSFFFELSWVDHTESDNRWVPLKNPVNNMTSSIVVRVDGYEGSKRVSVLSSSLITFDLHPGQEYLLVVAAALVGLMIAFLYVNLRGFKGS